jgi:hypothetical protein
MIAFAWLVNHKWWPARFTKCFSASGGPGEDSALLRGHQAVVVSVPDLHRYLDLLQRHAPRSDFEGVVVRRTACSLPEGLVHHPRQNLLGVLAGEEPMSVPSASVR